MAEVEKVRTPATVEQVSQALDDAWERLNGEQIEPKVRRLLLALADLETNVFQSMYNWNLGNIIVVSDSPPFYRALDTGNPRRFRAYLDLDSGAEGLIRQITSPTRPQWHEGLLSGNPREFVQHLKGVYGGPSYFEADLSRYMSGFLNRWEKYSGGPEGKAPAPGSAPLSPLQQSFSSGVGGFEINVDCVGLPHLGVDTIHHNLVQVAQAMLYPLTDPPLTIDGQYGPKTQKAVVDYQLGHNLTATGIIDALVWASLINSMKELS